MSVFPTLLAKWPHAKEDLAAAGFKGAGLFLINRNRPMAHAVGAKPVSAVASPSKSVKDAVLQVISPTASNETQEALTRT